MSTRADSLMLSGESLGFSSAQSAPVTSQSTRTRTTANRYQAGRLIKSRPLSVGFALDREFTTLNIPFSAANEKGTQE
jgi:hypothetical protein